MGLEKLKNKPTNITPSKTRLEMDLELDAEQIVKELRAKENTKEYDTLRLNKLIVDGYRKYAKSVGIKRYGNIIEKVLMAGLRQLEAQSEELKVKKK